ncbi:MAG: class I SAM-dependent methyltransferase [Pseudanabaenaceae cyanobacterium]
MSEGTASDIASSYGWSSAAAPHSCHYLAPRILGILKALQVRRVLDIGAGNGYLCSVLAQAGYAVAGVEYDPVGVQIAKESYPGLAFYNYGVQDDPNLLLDAEPPFDAVVSTEVVEHLFFPHLLPLYAKAVLVEKGHLIITTPYHGYLKNLAIALLGKWDSHHTALWYGGHIKFWSRRTLAQLLRENGFTEVGFSGVGRLPYLWKSMVMVAQKV